MNRTRITGMSEFLLGLGLLLAPGGGLSARAQSPVDSPAMTPAPSDAPPFAAGSPFAASAEGKPPAPPTPSIGRSSQNEAGGPTAAPLPSASSTRGQTRPATRDDAPQIDFDQADGLITLHTDELDVRRLLEVISRRSGLNLAISPKVQGTITANFEKVSIQELLRAVLKLANLVEKVDGEIHFIYSREEVGKEALSAKKERTVIKVYRLNYIRADEMMVMIAPFLSDDVGKKRFATTANYQYGISESSTLTTGGMGSTSSGGGGGGMAGAGGGSVAASGGTIQRGTQPVTGGLSYSDNDTLVIQDYETNIKVIDQIIQRLDVQPVQVLIEAVIISVELTKDTQLGVNFAVVDHLGQQLGTIGSGAAINSNVGFTPSQVLTAAGKIAASTADPTGFASGANGIKYGFVANNVTGFINALETLGSTKILASPRILVLNKQRAEIQLGERLGFRTLSQNFTSTIQQVQFLNTGTLLRIRPFVSSDGMVRMEIHPERSQGAVTDDLPNVTTAQLTTNVMVANGSTLVIGGLMEEEDVYNQTGLPGLSRLPALGHLFGLKDKLGRRRELVVLLTPHIWTAGPAPLHGADLARAGRAGNPDGVKQAAADVRPTAPATAPPLADLALAPGPEPIPIPVPAPLRVEQPPSASLTPTTIDRAASPPGEPVLLDVGSRIDAMRAGRLVPSAPILASPPITSRDAPKPKADPAVALAGYKAEAPAAPKKVAGRRHAVRVGETFETIAKSYYGSPRFSRALWWANRGAIAWPGALAVGKQIVIPPVDDLDRKMLGPQQAAIEPSALPTLEPIAAQPPGVRHAPPSRPAPSPAPRVDPEVQPARAPKPRDEVDPATSSAIHVVRPNETLRGIARAWFGDDSRAGEIAELNRDLLQAEGRPRVGQRLILPTGASSARPAP
ncbi:LysM peptidoglycan-binding domain-containing protein [Paludisphaera borealis]|nr:LysM peptidoglycan-binding domain-containing protein [Paludisphaera borealis]